MWIRRATDVMSVHHAEKRVNLSVFNWSFGMSAELAVMSGRTSESVMGLTRSNVSLGFEKCRDAFWRKAGPDSQFVVLREAAVTDLEPWSAGLCSVGT